MRPHKIYNKKKLEVTKAALLGNASSEDIERALAQFKKGVTDALEAQEFFKKHKKVLDIDEVSETAIISLFKRGTSLLDNTGIVVVGYGDEDYFPSAIVYRCYGVVLEKFLFTEESRKHINQDDVSHIMPLAQSDMVKTFVNGISPTAAQEIEKSFSKAIDEFCNTIKISGDSAQKARNKACEDFIEDILNKMFDSHTMPLKRVVGNLPIDELADLAETFIDIESLKERVTRPTQSIGGPVDVAVISKGDGFIWVKRKHYFDKDLNPRFMMKLAHQNEEG